MTDLSHSHSPSLRGAGFSLQRALARLLPAFLSTSLAFAGTHPPTPITAVAFSPDARWLVSSGYREAVVWDVAGATVARKITPLPGTIRAFSFHPDGRTLAAAGGVPGRSGTVTLIDFATGAASALETADDEMLTVAFSPDGTLLATGGANSQVHVWSTGDHRLVTTLKDHNDWISGVAFSPDGKLLATGSTDKTVLIWDTKTWKTILRLPQTLTEVVNGVAFSPEGDILGFASGGSDERAIRIWRAQNAFVELDPARPGQRNAIVQTRPLDTGACLPLAVTFISARPHSRFVVACADNTLKLIGPGGNQFALMTGHRDWVYAVAAAPDGTRIASGSGDGTVKIWGPAGRLLATLAEEPKP